MSFYGLSERQLFKRLAKHGFTDIHIVEGLGPIIEEETEKILEKNRFKKISPIWNQDAFHNAPSSLNECLEYFADKPLFMTYYESKKLLGITLQVNRDNLEDLILGRHYISEFVLYRPGLAVMIYDTESTEYSPAGTLRAKVFFGQVKTKLKVVSPKKSELG